MIRDARSEVAALSTRYGRMVPCTRKSASRIRVVASSKEYIG
ncbi:MAG: hypothetical protein ACXQTY_07265 [Candidatus Methanogasteraceae archaeon]